MMREVLKYGVLLWRVIKENYPTTNYWRKIVKVVLCKTFKVLTYHDKISTECVADLY